MDLCEFAQSYANDWLSRTVTVFVALNCLSTVFLLAVVVKWRTHFRVAMHHNLKVES